MIIGPNGTGKSTISSAIALGLGWNPKVMARGEDLRSFIKQGMDWAETEVELKGKRGKKNMVIYRRFTREQRSEWKLNGAFILLKRELTFQGRHRPRRRSRRL